MQEKLFKINELAKFFNINTSAIRYYEEYGLLKPFKIDTQTKYRYYNLKNVSTLSYIMELRKSGMSMEKIKNYLNEEFSREMFVCELEKQKEQIEHLIQINKLKSVKYNEYIVENIVVPEKTIFSKDYVATDLDNLYSFIYEFLAFSVKNAKVYNIPIIFIEFDTLSPVFENINVKICTESEFFNQKSYISKSFKALRTFHKGSYEDIAKAYNAIIQYAKEHSVSLKGNALEYYHESFSLHKDSNNNLTEIILPIN